MISQGGKGILFAPEDSIITDVLTTFGQLVASGDYAQALALWQSSQGKVDEYLYWYNLGSLQLQMGQFPEARLALEKAQLKTIYSQAASKKLALVEEKLADNGQREEWIDHVNAGLTYLGPTKLWLLVLILLLPLVFAIKSQASKRFLTFATSLGLAPVVFVAWFQLSTASFVALAPQTLYDGPSKIFVTGRMVQPGTKVLAREREGWWYIVFPPSAQGWLPKDQSLESGALWGMK